MRVAALDSGTGELELPEDEFGDLLLPPFKKDATDLHEVGFNLSILMPADISEIRSPSHAISVRTVDPAGRKSNWRLSTTFPIATWCWMPA